MSKFVEDVVLLLYQNHTALGLPSNIRMDFLPEAGSGVNVQMQENPKTEKEYINGSKMCRGVFRVLAQGTENSSNSAVNLAIVSQLEAVAALFEGMNKFQLSGNRTVFQCEATVPSIVSRDDGGTIVYGITIDCLYKEH